MKMEKLTVLSKDEIELIHSASMELLSTVGIKIDAQDVRDLLQEKGAIINDNSKFVKFPENFVEEQIKKVPSSFKLHGPDGSFNFEVNMHDTIFATIGTPVKIYDTEKNI